MLGSGGTFKDGVFVEAKAYNPSTGIYLDSPRRTSSSTGETEGKWQITGYLDALRRTEAGKLGRDEAVPALFLATPAGVRISTDLVRQASRDGVGLFHSILTTPLGDDNKVKFRMSESAILNPGVYDRKSLTPLDFRLESQIREVSQADLNHDALNDFYGEQGVYFPYVQITSELLENDGLSLFAFKAGGEFDWCLSKQLKHLSSKDCIKMYQLERSDFEGFDYVTFDEY